MTAAPISEDVLVLDYLAALWAAGEDLPPEVRDELMSTVAGYITARRDLAGDPGRVISLLGPPEQLVAAVRRSGTPTHLRLPPIPAPAPAAVPVVRSAGGTERAAVALLVGGSVVLPGAAQAAAMLLVSRSPSWSQVEKSAAWLLVAAPVTGLLFLTSVLFDVSVLSGVTMLACYLAATTGSIVAGLTLRRSL
ncbi:HAAS signaling domain-containing protein [Actinoplanes couchii]|uniref:DUF1700 domain-containing protein n=1 Tax=Actinoplanes couchii TaxID=403638 RepID=A0ABQ3XCX9_9ACTN|nr:hypothetical protein [Actinoplanes couchii]MDR6321232.1 hypothetical protein [Actinoplanes couchii]GID56341.1 hypothetical protein Aco03nite_047450 [Actinoplanes couchii]